MPVLTEVIIIDIYLLIQDQDRYWTAQTIDDAGRELRNSPVSTWPKAEDPTYVSNRVVRFSLDATGSIGGKHSAEVCDELRRVRLDMSDFEARFGVDIVILPAFIRSAPPQLAVFDMDSTLIQAEVVDELARGIGKMEQVAAITEMAMNGQVDFVESLRLRVRLLRGVPVTVWDDLKTRIQFMPGAKELTRVLSRRGIKMAVFSGGFREMALWVGNELGIHRAAANLLVSSDPTSEFPYPHLTGELAANVPIITSTMKRELLQAYAKENQVSLSRTLCVGDGANDLDMLGACGSAGGLAVAFRAKAKVQNEAPNRLRSRSLTDILYIMGMKENEIQRLSHFNHAGDNDSGIKISTLLMPGLNHQA